MFKKVLYVLFVLVLVSGCAPKALTQTPTLALEEFSPVLPAETVSPLVLRDPCELRDKEVDLLSYQRTTDNKLSLVMRERDSGSLVAVKVTIFYYMPLRVENGVTSGYRPTDTLTQFDMSGVIEYPPDLSYERFDFPSNSSGTVYCRIGDGFSHVAVTGLFTPTERDLYIQGLVNAYQANRDIKTEMLGVRALHNAALVNPANPAIEMRYYSLLENSLSDWDFKIPGNQCWSLTRSYKEWGIDWEQYTALRQMCGFKNDMLSLYGWSDPYRGLAIDFTGNGNKVLGDFARYYSYAGGMLPSIFDLIRAHEEICPGGQVSLPNGMTGTAYESPRWVDIDGGFVFEHGIDFVVSFGEQHFFIPYGGYFVVTDAAHTPDEYALFTTCSER